MQVKCGPVILFVTEGEFLCSVFCPDPIYIYIYLIHSTSPVFPLFPVSSLSLSPSFPSCSVFLAVKSSPNAELNPGTTYPVLHKIPRTKCIPHLTFGSCVTVSRLITGIFRKEEWKIALKF